MMDGEPLVAAPDRTAADPAGAWNLPAAQIPDVVAYLLGVADDELLLGHRDSEWTGLGPILEEDIALSSMAQDEMGHALVWYGLLQELGQPEPDMQVYLRDPEAWRSAILFELPRGDYAWTLVRRYLADVAEAVRYDALAASTCRPIASAAARIRQEEKYHLIHGRTMVHRLATATTDSRSRVQAALDALSPYALGIWEAPPGEAGLAATGVVPTSAVLQDAWLTAVVPPLLQDGLTLPVEGQPGAWRLAVEPVTGGRLGRHTADLDELLGAVQSLRRTDPGASW